MPKRYEAIRDQLVQSGKGYDEAQRIAAATYNKTRKPSEPSISNKPEDKQTLSDAFKKRKLRLKY